MITRVRLYDAAENKRPVRRQFIADLPQLGQANRISAATAVDMRYVYVEIGL